MSVTEAAGVGCSSCLWHGYRAGLTLTCHSFRSMPILAPRRPYSPRARVFAGLRWGFACLRWVLAGFRARFTGFWGVSLASSCGVFPLSFLHHGLGTKPGGRAQHKARAVPHSPNKRTRSRDPWMAGPNREPSPTRP